MANDQVQALLAQLAKLDMDELSKLTKEAGKLKRDQVAKENRAKLKEVFAPLFDAMDKAIQDNPELRELIEKKDALRIYFTNEQRVNRETYHNYGQRTGEAGGNGTKVWHRKDGKVYQFPSGRAMLNWLKVPDSGASFRKDAAKADVKFLEVKPLDKNITIIE